MFSGTDMNVIILFLNTLVTIAGQPSLTITPTCFDYNQSITLTCQTDNQTENLQFLLDNTNKGGCFPAFVPVCGASVPEYETPVQTNGILTSMTITRYDGARDDGSWTCTYDNNASAPVHLERKLCSKQVKSTTWSCGRGCWAFLLFVIVIIAYVIVLCSNENCKTYDKCWRCKTKCHSDFPIHETESSTEWYFDHFKNTKKKCRTKICCNCCCTFLVCFGCFLKKLPALRKLAPIDN